MMRFVMLVLLAVATCEARAVDVSGTYVGDVPRRDGGVDTTTFEFALDGERLTGTVTTPTAKYEIKDGRFENDQLQFFILVNMGRDVKFIYTGKAIDDEIGFVRDIQGMDRRAMFIAKRVK